MTSKRCTKCGVEKHFDQFSRDKAAKCGRRSRCKECINKQARDRRENDPEYRKRRSDQVNRCRREKMKDPEYAENRRRYNNKWHRDQYAANPDYRRKKREQEQKRRKNSEYLKRYNEHKSKWSKKRYSIDSDYRCKKLNRCKDWRKRHCEINPDYNKKRWLKAKPKINDSYVKKLIHQQTRGVLSTSQIPDHLITLKRRALKLKRLIKQKKDD